MRCFVILRVLRGYGFRGLLLLFLAQLFFHSGNHFFRIWSDRGFEALDYISVAIDQELGEIPLDFAGDGRCGLFGEVLVERRLIVTLY